MAVQFDQLGNHMFYEKYCTLHSELTDSETPNYSYLLYLGQKITGHQMGKDLDKKLGKKRCNALDVLDELTDRIDWNIRRNYWDSSKNKIKDYDPDVNWEAAFDELVKFKENLEKHVLVCKIKIMIYEKKVQEMEEQNMKKSKELEKEIKKIEELVKEKHNKELAKELHVYHLYNNGELTNQKGGELYLSRSEFTFEAPLVVPNFTFPIECGKRTYAILSEEDAHCIRNMMVDLSN